MGQVEDLQESVGDRIGAVLLDFQAHGRSTIHMTQLLLDGVKKILRLLLVHIEIAIARDAKQMGADHLHTMEQGSDKMFDDAA